MAVCAKAVQQADGSLALVLDPVATDLSTCAYVVQSGAELENNLFFMTAEDGVEASFLIITMWFVGYGVRALINMFRGAPNEK